MGSNAIRWNAEPRKAIFQVRVIDLVVSQGGAVEVDGQHRRVVLEIPIGGENGPIAAVGGGAD